MNSPVFLISSFLELYNNNIEEFKKKLYENSILCKDYVDEGLLLVYNKFDSIIRNDFIRESRSLIIDKKNMKIISYSCETPRYNFINLNTIPKENLLFTECYEGTLLSVFYHDATSKWYISTRRCLNSSNSKINDISHYNLFEQVIREKYSTIDEFTNELDKNKSYYFVLLHHLNKNIIDYTWKFGTEYKCLCLVSVRDDNMNEINLYDNTFSFINEKIFICPKLDSLDNFFMDNYKLNYNYKPNKEGVIIKIWNNIKNKYDLFKYQYKNYSFHIALSNNNNIYRGLTYLYQINKLNEYLTINPIFSTIENYNTVDIINTIFKVLTSELLQLYKYTCINKNINKQLPYEYKSILHELRLLRNHKYSTGNSEKLLLADIYYLVKSLPINILINLIKSRANMLLNNKDISKYCTKLQIEMIDLLIDKL